MPFAADGTLLMKAPGTQGVAFAAEPCAKLGGVGIFLSEFVTALTMGLRLSLLSSFLSRVFSVCWVSCLKRGRTKETAEGDALVVFDPKNYCVRFQSCFFSKFGSNIRLSLNHDFSDNPSVIHLVLTSCPAAVCWCVIGVIIFSVQSSAIWSWAEYSDDIRIEFCVAMLPFRAHFYASTTVILVLIIFLVTTTAQHFTPRGVQRWVAVFPRHAEQHTLGCRLSQGGH